MKKKHKTPSLLLSILPLLFLIILLSTNVYVFKDNSSYGPNQIALILASAFAVILSFSLNYQWNDILKSIVKSISSAISAILILLMIGALAGTWLISGIVPAMIYYGLEILNPTIFLFATTIVSAVVSLATGSSWSTTATIGIALMGIGQTLGINEGVIAGAIISGAYFGDKMSPLSDTTNLAPSMAGTDLFSHIKYMSLTTGPSIIITLIIFLIWGFTFEKSASLDTIKEVQESIASRFEINLFLFIIPVIVIIMIIKKIPALPSLFIGTVLAGVFAMIFQPQIISYLGDGNNGLYNSYKVVLKSMYTDININTNNEMVNQLLTSSGMKGILPTVWLIICAMIFGGIIEGNKMLKVLASTIIKMAHSTGSLIAATAGTCIVFNVTASDQYIAIVVPGRMFKKEYKERGLSAENLSRTLEDTGTVTSVLIPWNTCGAYQSSVLNVNTLTYLPYCFFNMISPFMTILFGYANIKIKRIKRKKEIK